MSYLSLIRRRGDLVRFRQVMAVLLRHGFGYVIYRLRLGEHVPLFRRFVKVPEEEKAPGVEERLRLVCEELGPTYIKFGQLMSSRIDIIPPRVARELARLQDHAPPFPFHEAREIVEAELGRSLEETFADFSTEPLAAASIAQVHRAVLPGGEKVVVKIQRPGIRKEVTTDLDILEALARGLERHIPESRGFYPVDLVRLFRKTIGREMDFFVEARNAERFRHNFAGSPDLRVPKVYWKLTTERVMVMEDLEGVRVDDEAGLRALGIDRAEIARRGAKAFLKQVFIDRFFHADPHPGNFSVLADGRIALVDYGMVGRLDAELVGELSAALLAVADWNAAAVARHILRMNVSEEEIDEDAFRSDLAYFVESYAGRPLGEINLGGIINEMIYLASRYRIKLPSDMVLLGKAIVTMEGVGRRLDPDFDMIAAARSFARDYMLSRFSPARIKERAEQMATELAYFIKDLPADLQVLFKKVARGRFKIEFQHRGLETFISEMDKSSNRLSFGLIVAALIIGSSLISLSDRGPRMFGLPLLGFAGFVLAGLLGLWLIFGIMRSGRL